MNKYRNNYVFTNVKNGIFFFCMIVFLGCSTSPKLVALDENKIERIAIVPALAKDILQTYYKKEINGEIYVDYQPNKEEQYTLQNYMIYYTTDNPYAIGEIIKDLKNATPSIFSVFGASYGVPIFRLEIIYKSNNKECIDIVPTPEVKEAFYKNRARLDYLVLRKYDLYKKELGPDLIRDLKVNNSVLYLENHQDSCGLNERSSFYTVLLEFSTHESYGTTQDKIDTFLATIEDGIGKRDYLADRQSSNSGFPISVHLYLRSNEEVKFVKEQALISKYKFFYKPETITVWLPVNHSQSIKNIIDLYELRTAWGHGGALN